MGGCNIEEAPKPIACISIEIASNRYFGPLRSANAVTRNFMDGQGRILMMIPSNEVTGLILGEIRETICQAYNEEVESGRLSLYSLKNDNIYEKITKIIEMYRKNRRSDFITYGFILYDDRNSDRLLEPQHTTALVLALRGTEAGLYGIDSAAAGEYRDYIDGLFGGYSQLLIGHSRAMEQRIPGACSIYAMVDAMRNMNDPGIMRKISDSIKREQNERYLYLKMLRILFKLNRAQEPGLSPGRREHLRNKFFEYMLYTSAMRYTRSGSRKEKPVDRGKVEQLCLFGIDNFTEYMSKRKVQEEFGFTPGLINKLIRDARVRYADLDEGFVDRIMGNRTELEHLRDVLDGNRIDIECFRKPTSPLLSFEQKTAKTLRLRREPAMVAR